ncbi:MAG: hypothetical protein KJ000_12755 [Pirellulaceae bacterium]|nr:hypothetical protein [Pirellulaceae bacterium]
MQPDLPSLELWSRGSLRGRLCFVWNGDRYAHRLQMTDGGEEEVCLESLEGVDGENWPPSPALQQLSFQSGASGEPCALLVGMAGKSHWSMSVEANELSLLFDVACRVHEPPERLGSRYRVVRPGTFGSRIRENSDVSQRGPNSHEFGYEQAMGVHASKSVSLCESPRLVVEAEANEGLVVLDNGDEQVAVLPAGTVEGLPVTLRWRYRLRLVLPAGPFFAGSRT